MPFLATFSCLWCGRAWQTRGPDDLEGWTQLCADCIGAAGDDGFRRMRLRAGLAERAAAGRALAAPTGGTAPPVSRRGSPAADRARARPSSEPASDMDADEAMRAYYRARAPTYDDWYLRRGRVRAWADRRPGLADGARHCDAWLDALPLAGEIVELAAGTGWWSPLLAGKGELWCTTPCPRRSTWRAAGSSPMGCGRTSTNATCGPSRIDRSMPSSAASGSAMSRGRGSPTSCRSAGAGSSRARRSRSSTLVRIPPRERRPTRGTRRPRRPNDASATRHSGSPRCTTPPTSSRVRFDRGLLEASVTTTPRFFVLGSARVPRRASAVAWPTRCTEPHPEDVFPDDRLHARQRCLLRAGALTIGSCLNDEFRCSRRGAWRCRARQGSGGAVGRTVARRTRSPSAGAQGQQADDHCRQCFGKPSSSGATCHLDAHPGPHQAGRRQG